LGAAFLCRPLKNSRESGLSGARCSCHADHTGDFRRGAFMFRVGVDPFQDLGVAFLQFLFQRLGVNARERQKLLVKRAGVMVIAALAGDFRPALVEAARQNHIAAQPHARAARRLLCQIRSMQ